MSPPFCQNKNNTSLLCQIFFFPSKLCIFRLFLAYVELNARLRIKQEKIKQKFPQARIHIVVVSAGGGSGLSRRPPKPPPPLSDHHLDDMELKQTVSRGRNEV